MLFHSCRGNALPRFSPPAQDLGNQRGFLGIDPPQPVPSRVTDFDRRSGLSDDTGLFFGECDVWHRNLLYSAPAYQATRATVKPSPPRRTVSARCTSRTASAPCPRRWSP